MVPGSPAGLPSGIPTMPQLLRRHGYKTTMIGKWYDRVSTSPRTLF
jgi:arylsulfatase A-like enzyme